MINSPGSRFRSAALLVLLLAACDSRSGEEMELSWAGVPDRPWAGPALWTNRLQDWEVRAGRLEVSVGQPMRTAHILTARTNLDRGGLEVVVELGIEGALAGTAGAGILLGAGGPDLDWRKAALIHHSPGAGGGLFAGIDHDGRLFVRDFSDRNQSLAQTERVLAKVDSVELSIRIVPDAGGAILELTASPSETGADSVILQAGPFESVRLTGGLALVADAPDSEAGTVWFSRLQASGRGFEHSPERTLGPVLGAQHTLSRGVLTLTAQLFPVGGGVDLADPATAGVVQLDVRSEAGGWYTLGLAPVVVPGYTATFRVEGWPVEQDVPYRLGLLPADAVAAQDTGTWFEGRVRADPSGEDEIVVAAFTGNHNVAMPGVDRGEFDWMRGVWFPHADIVNAVRAHDPDLLFFSGDQVYEGASPTSADLDRPYLDYLYKWYLWMWAFRDLTAEIPAITIPDDHDVFHGNVWGAGGRATPPGLTGAAAQDAGGYKLPPAWVNMVQRTQTSHLPLPFDPAPAEQEIGVYYTDVLYGGVSFAVIEDRKFKSAPAGFLPDADIWNGWARDSAWDARMHGDSPGADLLGERQERFLEEWAADWSDGTWMKVLLSQTIFANIATIPADAMTGSVIPGLPIPQPGEWVEGDKQAADMDSNGWPRSGRNRALRAIRKGFAVHLAGDQHLASTIRYGIDHFGDAGYALCVPSVANFWPRRWYPPSGGPDRSDGLAPGTGDFLDGFGNRMTVLAVSNPARWGREPATLHDRAPGYGIATFSRTSREVSLAAWPRWANPGAGDQPYPGWPVRFEQLDGYGREPWGFLPTLLVQETVDPVVQVQAADGEIVYTLRIRGDRFTPRVFEPGVYTIRVIETGTESLLLLPGLEAMQDSTRTIEVEFP
jgi:phosphodiesterase/alkaline phosphatase D-like protein